MLIKSFHRFIVVLAVALTGCSGFEEATVPGASSSVSLPEVARMFSALPLESEHLGEVYDAVCSSSGNGYDEEYMMKDLFTAPGSGVGDDGTPTKAASYSKPLRSLVEDYLRSNTATRADGSVVDADDYIAALTDSDVQLYWPYSQSWDGHSYPIITFDPGTDAVANEGYEITLLPDGTRSVNKVIIDEQTARTRPVWVVNRNDDSAFTSLEMLRRGSDGWGEGGIIVLKTTPATRSGENEYRTLVLRDFMVKRNFDTWFGGASEFFVKCGVLENFTASTEAELRLYEPRITDFMIVVKRSQTGAPIPFNAVLVSDWTEQLEEFALMIIEDDGGTTTSWKCETVVKVNSKSYGITLDLPFRTRDDIVWRGMLSSNFLERFSGVAGHYGDVDLTFDFI